ncbi:MFS transporter, sugar porter (SP) family [Saccharopolyspora kobensis]|uniref:MFS transporter, sugar porter (SP) family n=2 Tax=Saccharopolyspora kobensis TaxID=146035 RepID=A0A1H5VCW8_9PSEU|nr:MFS transporter, sugar porter (SP) family [Saccharopolyspora kobensis]SFC62347.1 MFS transporter, sugar porter (SP) family [Saccharopolyspora kobensis]
MVQGFSTEPGTHGPITDARRAAMRKVWVWAVIIAVGGFLFGFDTGVISGALLYLAPEFDLSPAMQGGVVSVLLLGAMVGALGIGGIADRLGRRPVLGLEGAVFLAGTALAVSAQNYATLMVARVVLGLAVGSASATVPIYLSEIAPTAIRGRVLTLNQLMITIGILSAYVVNVIFSPAGAWRWMLGMGAIPALVLVAAGLGLVPESARWLLDKGRRDEAKRTIMLVTDEATAERLISAHDAHQHRPVPPQRGETRKSGWAALLSAAVRPALIVGLVLAAVQQFGGINTIIYYAPTIMTQTGLSASNSIVYSIAIGVINLIMAVVAIKLIDKVGRRPLLIISLAGMAISIGMLGASFALGMPPVVTLLFMVVYIAVYSGGLGPIFWTLIGELFPPSARADGSSACTAVNWASNFTVSAAFLPVVTAIGAADTFYIFAGICVFALLFVFRYVPETRNKDYPQIDSSLRQRFHLQTT